MRYESPASVPYELVRTADYAALWIQATIMNRRFDGAQSP